MACLSMRDPELGRRSQDFDHSGDSNEGQFNV